MVMTFVMCGAVIGLAAIAALAPIDPAVVERHFSTRLYPAVQTIVTPLSNLVPFALFDLLTCAAALTIVVVTVRGVRRARQQRRFGPLLAAVGRLATAAAVAYLAFLVLWGLNYRRVPMTERLQMNDETPTTEAVVGLGRQAVEQLNTLYSQAHRIGWTVEPRYDTGLHRAFALVQQQLSEAPPAVPGRLKQTIYGPYFRWTSVDGMINPFALEVLANPDLLPFERPFVAAHEWAHLAGFADESEANFVGWLVCLRAEAPARYSAWQYVYWQVYGEVANEHRLALRDALADGPRRDLDAIADRVRRGQLPMLRNASWRVYDQYLRANRVEEGIRSYGEVITLILRARFDEGWIPVRRSNGSSR
jgi:hypothetical protein